MKGFFLSIGVALTLTACVSPRMFHDSQLRVEALEQQTTNLEQRILELEKRQGIVAARSDSLARTLPNLSKRADQLESDQRTMRTQISQTMKRAEAAKPEPDATVVPEPVTTPVVQAAPAPVPAPQSAPRQGTSSDQEAQYQAARQLYTAGDVLGAIKAFSRFIERYPDHELASNCQYWLGECYYDQKNYSSALAEFRKVVDYYPSSPKAPDAAYKVGLCYHKTGLDTQARTELELIHKHYPKYERQAQVDALLKELK
jgi:tol-pal system protein YbgF